MFESFCSRRGFLALSLAGIGTRAWAGVDRPLLSSTGSSYSAVLNCNNDNVPVSDTISRISKVSDFMESETCRLVRDSYEGPFFLCTNDRGRAIARGLAGQPLIVALRVTDSACNGIGGATVDVWNCDATGAYSGYGYSPDDENLPWVHEPATNDERFCRGVLNTDDDGIVEFDTVYPSFYTGRPIHIHFKVSRHNKSYVTNQALLPEAFNDLILQTEPYNGPRTTARVENDDEPDLPTFHVEERAGRLLAVLNIGLPNEG